MSNVPCTFYFPRQRFSHSLVGDMTPDNSCCQTTAQFAVIVCLLLIITVNVVIMLRPGQGTGVSGGCCAPYRKIRSSAFPAHSKTHDMVQLRV